MEPLVLLAVFGLLMYFAIVRPQQRQAEQKRQLLKALGLGEDVITVGGMHGSVVARTDKTVDLEVTDDIVLRFQLSSIAQVVSPIDDLEDDDDEDGADEDLSDSLADDSEASADHESHVADDELLDLGEADALSREGSDGSTDS